MKRFITTVLTVSVFFIGLGAMIENVGARFRSDEKALEIIRAARAAIGGEAAIKEIRGLVIVGKSTNSIKLNGVDKTETGETEIAFQLPDQLMKTIKIGSHDGDGGDTQLIQKRVDVEVIHKTKDGSVSVGKGEGKGVGIGAEPGGKKIIVKEVAEGEKATWVGKDGEAKVFVRKQGDGGTWTSKDGTHDIQLDKVAAHHGAMRQNELLRTTLGLLLTAPDGMDVSYTFVGEGDVDGTAVNIINASFGGATYKLFIGRANNLPVAMSYTGHAMPVIMHFNKEVTAPKDGNKDVMVFKRHDEMAGKSAEFTVKFSDYRTTGSVQLPYKWTTAGGGQTTEVFDVTSYDINPANIAEKFKDQKVKVRMKHPDGK